MRFTTTLAALAVFLCALTAQAAHRARLNETAEMSYDVRAGSPISVETFNGSIHVRGSDDAKVHVTVTKHVQAETDEEAREAMAALRVETSHDNGGLVLKATDVHGDREIEGGISFDITTPRSVDLTLNTTNGSIDVSDIRGDAKLKTTNGQINVLRGSGSLDIETTNGGIRAELLDVTPNRPLKFLTTNGGVTLELPSNLGADVVASTTNGTISSDLPIVANSSDHRHLEGRINGGGSELRVRTTNGTISIRTSSAQR